MGPGALMRGGGTAVAAIVLVVVGVGSAAAEQDRRDEGELAADPHHATPCAIGPTGDRSVTCFDPGNRVIVDGTTDGRSLDVRVALLIRHTVVADDPTVTWRLEHAIADAAGNDDRVRGAAYRLRLVRHSIDGHVMLPTSPPTRLHFPFDLGVELAAGVLDWRRDQARADLGVFRAAPMFDLYRARDFGLRVALGATARWDVEFDVDDAGMSGQMTATEHVVTPLSEGALVVHAESGDGRTALDLRVRAGMEWSTAAGWTPVAGADAALERVLIAVNDVPISAVVAGGWGDDGLGGSGSRQGWGSLGLRVGLGAGR